jgi:hypothetical protein
VYYGNDAVGRVSSGDATFVFFDDFESLNLNKWSNVASQDFSTSTSRVKQGTHSLYYNGGDWTICGKNFTSGPASFMFHVWVQADNVLRGAPQDVIYADNVSGVRHCHIYEGYLTYDHTPNVAWPQNSAVSSDVWYEIEMGFDMAAAKSRAWKDGAYCGETDLLEVYHRWTVNNTYLSRYIFAGWKNYPFWIDELYIRKWLVSEPVHGAWSAEEASSGWLLGWSFRRAHTMDGLAGAGTDYQIRITTHYGLGTDSGGDVYCDYNCQPDFDDVRFTDDDGVTLLDYWIEDMVQSDYASIWVEVADNLDSSVRIYVYYGNAAATSASNGDATFIFFDDFESGTLDANKWQVPGDWQAVESNVKHGSYAAFCVALAPSLTMWADLKMKNLDYSFMLHVWARFGGISGSAGYPVLFKNSGNYSVCSVMVYDGQCCSYNNGGNPTSWPANNSISTNTYYETEVGFDLKNQKQRGWKSGSYMGEVDLKDIFDGAVSGVHYYCPSSGYHLGEDVWIDDCYIRKWFPNEPQHAAWGVIDITNGTTSPHITDGTASTLTLELLLWFFYSVTIVSIPVFLVIQSKRS